MIETTGTPRAQAPAWARTCPPKLRFVSVTRGQNAAAVDFRVKIDTSSATQAQAKYLKVTVSEAAVPPATTPTERPPGHVFVPASSEVFVYDDDGNLTKDGRWNYTWDAENRLATMTTREDLAITAPAPLPIVRLVFRYDAHWRRFDKSVQTKVGGAWQNTRQDRYAYDRWNLIGVIPWITSRRNTL